MNNRLGLSFGCLVPPLSEQLKEYNLSKAALKRLQKFHDAIFLLYASNIITDSERDKACQRFMKRIVKEIGGNK